MLLVAFDGSDDARVAVEQAARLFPGRPAIVVSVWASVEGTPAALLALPAGVAGEAQARLDESAAESAGEVAEEGARLARDGGLEATAEAAVERGTVWATLCELAEQREAAAVVVGSRGRSGVTSALLGSTSAGVAHHCSRPVVIVPPADRLAG